MQTLATRSTIFLRLKSDDTATREIAWADFRDRYAPIIAAFARKLAVKPQDVDDLVQDVMLGFFAHSPTFVYDPLKGRFRGYLKVCTLRAMQRRLGARGRMTHVSLDQVPPDDVAVEQVWNDVWEQQLLQRAMDETRREFKDDQNFRAFELHVVKGQSVPEVMRALGVSESSVHRGKSRVAAALRRRLSMLEDLES